MWTRIKRIWTAPVFEDEAQTRAARLLNTSLWFLLAVGLGVFLLTVVVVGVPDSLAEGFVAYAALTLSIAIGFFLFLLHRGRIQLASVLLLLLIWSLTTFWLLTQSGIAGDSSILTLTIVIVLGGVLLGGRGSVVFTLLSSATVIVSYLFQIQGWLPPGSPTPLLLSMMLIVIQFGLIGLLLRHAVGGMRDAMQQAQAHAQAQRRANRELEALRATLEQRVAERTRDLERRAAQLQLAADVGRVATSTLDAEQLLSEVTDLLYNRFRFYHVGFFETDPTGRWAEYRIGAGRGAQDLVQEGFRIEIGSDSLIGQCIAHAQPQVNQDTGEGGIYQPHPLLPDTRSEVALPLIARGQVIGAMDVQSDQVRAFDPKTLASLQTIADQVAVALDNARLLSESRRAVEATRLAYGELTRQTWSDLLRRRRDWGYRYTYRAIEPVTGDWPPEMRQALENGQSVQRQISGEAVLAIPLRVREQTVGVLSFYKPQDDLAWTPDEINVLEQIIQQMGVALESAQFYEESQQRAWQERIAREITARMRETLDVDTVLRTSLQEIRQALGLASMSVRLVEPTDTR